MVEALKTSVPFRHRGFKSYPDRLNIKHLFADFHISWFYYAKIDYKKKSEVYTMGYWVQETGTHHNFSNYRSFMCDYRTDINKLPRVGIEGEKQDGDTVSSTPCSHGSDCGEL